jgi:hypothetical protein
LEGCASANGAGYAYGSFHRQHFSATAKDASLGFAAGVTASFFSLILLGLEYAAADLAGRKGAVLIPAALLMGRLGSVSQSPCSS